MHEAAIAQSLLELIIAESEGQDSGPMKAHISCGTFECINDEVLSFAFDALAKDSICERTSLVIKHMPIRAKCRSCGHTFDFDAASGCCDICGSDSDLLPDEPLMLNSLEFETE